MMDASMFTVRSIHGPSSSRLSVAQAWLGSFNFELPWKSSHESSKVLIKNGCCSPQEGKAWIVKHSKAIIRPMYLEDFLVLILLRCSKSSSKFIKFSNPKQRPTWRFLEYLDQASNQGRLWCLYMEVLWSILPSSKLT